MYDDTSHDVSVVTVDNNPLAAEALKLMLDDETITVVASFTSADAAIQGIQAEPPQVAIVDLFLSPNARVTIDLIRTIRQISPSTSSLLLTAYDPGDQVLADAITAGAAGYYRKGYLRGESLPEIVKRLAFGETDITQVLARKLLQRAEIATRLELPPHLSPAPLSDLELRVLTQAAEGKRPRDIAHNYTCDEALVRRHFRNIVSKFHVGASV